MFSIFICLCLCILHAVICANECKLVQMHALLHIKVASTDQLAIYCGSGKFKGDSEIQSNMYGKKVFSP